MICTFFSGLHFLFGVFFSGGILSGGFYPVTIGSILSGGFCPGGFCPGTFCQRGFGPITEHLHAPPYSLLWKVPVYVPDQYIPTCTSSRCMQSATIHAHACLLQPVISTAVFSRYFDSCVFLCQIAVTLFSLFKVLYILYMFNSYDKFCLFLI